MSKNKNKSHFLGLKINKKVFLLKKNLNGVVLEFDKD